MEIQIDNNLEIMLGFDKKGSIQEPEGGLFRGFGKK